MVDSYRGDAAPAFSAQSLAPHPPALLADSIQLFVRKLWPARSDARNCVAHLVAPARFEAERAVDDLSTSSAEVWGAVEVGGVKRSFHGPQYTIFSALVASQWLAAYTVQEAAKSALLSKGIPSTMSTQEIIALALGLLQAFAGKNVVVQDIEVIVPEVEAALINAASGQAASVAFPLSVKGKAGTASFSWSPSA